MKVRQAATNIARDLEDAQLVAQVRDLPTIPLAGSFGANSPTSRNTAFDQAIEVFIEACYSRLDRLADLEIRVAENAGLSRAECRQRVLRHLFAAGREHSWSDAIGVDLALSDPQVTDALEQLDYEGALEAQKVEALQGTTWRARLSVVGRNLAEGSEASTSLTKPAIVINQEFHHSIIGSAGITQAPVTQNIGVFPQIPQDVRDFLEATEQGAESVHTYDEAVKQPRASVATLRSVVVAIKALIEGGNLATEVAAHGHEWLTAVTHLLSLL